MSIQADLDYSRERTLQSRVWTLEADNKRLRDALRLIEMMDRCLHPLCRSTQAAHIARDALAFKR